MKCKMYLPCAFQFICFSVTKYNIYYVLTGSMMSDSRDMAAEGNQDVSCIFNFKLNVEKYI